MNHPIYRVKAFQSTGDFALRLDFDDGSIREIDFKKILTGPLYSLLADPEYFRMVYLDLEIGTICWPNGADFDPLILHDWNAWESRLIDALAIHSRAA